MRDFVFPMFRANTVYEGEYLLGTSIARPLIAKRLIEIANARPAPTPSRHGATGKGNDQVRFELGAYALKPGHQGHRAVARMGSAVAREADGLCREARHPGRHEAQAGRLAVFDGRQPAAHLLRRPPSGRSGGRSRRSRCGAGRCRRKRRRTRPNTSTSNSTRATSSRINGKKMNAARGAGHAEPARRQARHRPSRPGREPLRRHEVARLLRNPGRHHPAARRTAPSSRSRLDREVAHLKDDLMPRYASLIYNGYWWSPERKALQVLIDHTQQTRQRLGAPQAVQGQRHRRRPRFEDRFAVRPDHRHLRGRCRRLRPEGRGRLHQAQRPAHAHRGQSGGTQGGKPAAKKVAAKPVKKRR